MRNFCWIVFVSLFVACTSDELQLTGDPVENEQAVVAYNPDMQYEQGYLRMQVSGDLAETLETAVQQGVSSTKALAADNTVAAIKIKSVKRTFPHAGRFEERSRKAGLHLWYDVEFDTQVPVQNAGAGLARVRGVRQVEYRPVVANYGTDKVLEYVTGVAQKASAAMPFNDPRLPDQWHYQNDGTMSDRYLKGADVNLFGAWTYTTGTPDVVVAIIDGGIDFTHEDLAANMWVNAREKNGTASYDDDNNGFKDDIHGYNFVSDIGRIVPNNHGTHVAGTVAAVNNNGKGISGIAGGNGSAGTGVRLMSCQIFVNDDDPYANSAGRKGASAIKYAADNGAVICQNSWGYPTLSETPASDKAAIDYFINFAGIDENGKQTGAMRGGMVVFAAGNEDRAAGAPASYPKVVAVTSIAPDYRKAYYSNYGDWADLAAPGGDIQSSGSRGTVLSTVVNGYGYMQGTSMACPHVSGVAALVLSKFKRSGYNADMLRARLESSATNIDNYNSSYKGKMGRLVNAMAAMAGGSITPPAAMGTVSGSVRSNIVNLKWLVPTDPDDGKASGFNVYYRKTPLTGLNVNNPPADVMIQSFPTGTTGAGAELEVEVADLDFNTLYYFMVNAFDFSGNFSALSPQLTVTTLANNPPVITVKDSTDVTMKAFRTVNLGFAGTDPDGHEVNWSLVAPPPGVELINLGGGNAQITLTGTAATPGNNSFSLKLEDKYGMSVTQNINFFVEQNKAPETVSVLENMYIGGLGRESSFAVTEYFTDKDGEPLRYTFVNTAPHIVNINENKGLLYVVSLAYGMADITVNATDAMGVTVTQQFKVLVRDGSKEIDVYPNPVKDFVWIRTGEDQQCKVTIYNNAGAKMLEEEVQITPFSPEKIDMSEWSGGMYTLRLNYAGKEINKQIVKL